LGDPNSYDNEPIIFYDGDCGFCQSSVQFVLDNRKQDFFFCSLHSDYAKKVLAENKIELRMDTIYYLKGGRMHDKSTAALLISKGLKGFWPLMICFYIVPWFIRDWIYDGIARRRHRIRQGFCMKPTREEEAFFIN
jgi:predicted DCC family thiol-disulfide oxidoreductase YuxK